MRIDITRSLSPETEVYPGDAPFTVERTEIIDGTQPYALSRVTLGMHTATHVDFPAHFFAGGKCQHEYPIDRFVLRALVIGELPLPLTREYLAGLPLVAGMALLLKTGLAPYHEREMLTEDGADFLVDCGIGLAGFDTAVLGDDRACWWLHKKLLGQDILIAENLALENAPPGLCRLYCLPLAVHGVEASPARALLEYD